MRVRTRYVYRFVTPLTGRLLRPEQASGDRGAGHLPERALQLAAPPGVRSLTTERHDRRSERVPPQRRAVAGRNGSGDCAHRVRPHPAVALSWSWSLDFGRLIQTRLIISNVSREGGSLASRQTIVDTTHQVLKASGSPWTWSGRTGGSSSRGSRRAGAAPEPDDHHADQPGRLAMEQHDRRGPAPTSGSAELYNHLVYNADQRDARTSPRSPWWRSSTSTARSRRFPNSVRGHAAAGRRRHDRLEQGRLLGPHECHTPDAPEGGRCREGSANESARNETGTVLIAFALFLFVLLVLRHRHGGRALVHGARRAVEERGRRGPGRREEHLQPVRPRRDPGRGVRARRTSRPATWARPAPGPAASPSPVIGNDKIQVTGTSAPRHPGQAVRRPPVPTVSTSVAQKKEVEIMLVLDRSGSMSGTPIADLKGAASLRRLLRLDAGQGQDGARQLLDRGDARPAPGHQLRDPHEHRHLRDVRQRLHQHRGCHRPRGRSGGLHRSDGHPGRSAHPAS